MGNGMVFHDFIRFGQKQSRIRTGTALPGLGLYAYYFRMTLVFASSVTAVPSSTAVPCPITALIVRKSDAPASARSTVTASDVVLCRTQTELPSQLEMKPPSLVSPKERERYSPRAISG